MCTGVHEQTDNTADSVPCDRLRFVAVVACLCVLPAAASAWRILRGEDAGSIPVIPPAEIEAGVNLSTALRHNLTLSSGLLELAGDNIVR